MVSNVSATCSLFVWDNAGSLPAVASPKIKMTYNVNTQGAGKWIIVNLTSQPQYSTDFWVGIWIPANNRNTLFLTDTLLNNGSRMAWKHASYAWTLASSSVGDFRIQVVVGTEGIEETELLPIEISLKQNFPNPVAERTTIAYAIPQEMNVKLEIYDITGRNVKTLVNEVQSAGAKEVVWDKKNTDGKPLPSGLYFYTLNAGNRSLAKTLIVL